MKELRDYQAHLASEASERLRKLGICYLAMEVRTGKTATAFEAARLYGARSVLFITQKKIKEHGSILQDKQDFGFTFRLELINYDSLHKVDGDFDLIILDEGQNVGTYPRPSNRAKMVRQKVGSRPLIILSGTPSPESYSQLYHQFWVSERSPFGGFKNFYAWAKAGYVDVRQKRVAYGNLVNDYSKGNKERIMGALAPYMLSYTQRQAGFNAKVNEHVIEVRMDRTDDIVGKLRRDKLIRVDGRTVLADTPVKEMGKVHQLYGGTVLCDDGTPVVMDYSKCRAIQSHFEGKKIAIYYKFRAELHMLKSYFGAKITESLSDFVSNDKWLALQIRAGREGISLSHADHIVFLNIDFSATSYWQARDRLTTKTRTHNSVYWVFSVNGIEKEIYATVQGKRQYTLSHYERGRLSGKGDQEAGAARLVRGEAHQHEQAGHPGFDRLQERQMRGI